MPGLRQATWSIWTIPPFFVDRGEDAVPLGPQPQQIRRPARERLRQPRLTGELADGVAERRDTAVGGAVPPVPNVFNAQRGERVSQALFLD